MPAVPALFRSTPFVRWFIAAVLARLMVAAVPIALLVVGARSYGSVAVGARLAAVFSISTAVLAPFRGRRLDRRGLSRGLRADLWWASLVGAGMAAGVHLRLEAPWVDLVAAVLGLSLAVAPAGFRALLTGIVHEPSLDRASNLDAVGFEISLIGAPLMVAAVAAVSDPAVIFWVGAVLTLISAVLLPVGREVVEAARRPARWRLPGTPVMAAALSLGVSGGLLEPAVFARVEELGRSESLAALFLAVVGVGSAMGGTIASVRPPPPTAFLAARFLTLHGLVLVAVAFTESIWFLAVWFFAAGAPIAPLMAIGATLLDRRVPPGERSTAFALAGSAIALGTGVGQAVAGTLISAGATSVTFLAAAGVVLLTAAVGWLLERT